MLILMVMANEFGLMVMVSIDASLMIIDVDLVMAMSHILRLPRNVKKINRLRINC